MDDFNHEAKGRVVKVVNLGEVLYQASKLFPQVVVAHISSSLLLIGAQLLGTARLTSPSTSIPLL